MEPKAAVQEFQEAVQELSVELERLKQNVQGVTQYQAQVFQVTKVLCCWMENIEGLARQRAELHSSSDSSR